MTMKLKFYGEIVGLEDGINILTCDLDIELAEDGIPVEIESGTGNIEVRMNKGSGYIGFDKKIHFFRAVGLFVEALRKNDSFKIIEEPQFESNGIMIDASRNAVPKVDSVKQILRKMALMGLNTLMLYTEDTYEIKTRPYFGYMRGRLSYNELKECDDFANLFGIEMVPCIQTLGHLEQALKWDYANEIKDTSDILLVGNEKVYEFIDEMIKTASSPFRSKKIHLGMDEAHNLGLGRYLDINGYQRRFDIMSNHLSRVKEITDKYGLDPMIWSDMFFRLGSKTGEYYDLDANIPKDVVKNIPDNLGLVYWDYYHNSEHEYREFIRKHKVLKRDLIFAGGIWTWTGLCINYEKTFITTNSALKACKEEGVKSVFATMWGDNGAETNIFSALLGLQLFAEHGYSKEVNSSDLARRFEFCTNCKLDSFRDLSKLDEVPGVRSDIANPSKYLLWQDILIGLFDKGIEGVDLDGFYSDLKLKFEKYIEENKEWKFVFEMPYKLCHALSLKSRIGVKIKKLYDLKDIGTLQKVVDDQLVDLYNRIEALRLAHRDQWLKTNKPFGWEIIDIRYGGLLARINSASARLKDYINGDVQKIEELEEERLYFGGFNLGQDGVIGCFNTYHRIVSACPM